MVSPLLESQAASTDGQQGAQAHLLQNPGSGQRLDQQADAETEHGQASVQALGAAVEPPATLIVRTGDIHAWLNGSWIEELVRF